MQITKRYLLQLLTAYFQFV